MVGEGRCRHAQVPLDIGDGQSLGSGANQQPEQTQPRSVSQCRQPLGCLILGHNGPLVLSMIYL